MPDRPLTPFAVSPADRVLVLIHTDDGHLLVTEERIATAHGDRVTMDVPIVEVRRIQLDIERRRSATFVIVPESPLREPQVVPIPMEHYDLVTAACAHIGRVIDALP